MTICLGSSYQADADDRTWLDPAQVIAFVLGGLRAGVPSRGQ